MNNLMNHIEEYYLTLALMDDESLSISDDDLLLLAEDYADLGKITKSSPKE
jgi:hypothetical protein